MADDTSPQGRVVWISGDEREEPAQRVDLDKVSHLTLLGGPIEIITEHHWRLPPGTWVAINWKRKGDA